MMKKSILVVLIVFVVCFGVGKSKANNKVYEKGNDNSHIEAAREISAFEGVMDAAVISYEGRTMAGVSIDESCDKGEIMLFVESVLKRTLGRDEEYYISVGDETAEKIIELSLYLDTDLDKSVLEQRTRFLLKNNNKI
ncbi:MAG: hypothetical protein IKB32_04375 [Clostridia bacterium]|nr:hypothetical protein [Clostridia bacterium]